MKYEIEKWSIEKLVRFVRDETITLQPPFQRNFIWGEEDQIQLIESISRGYPLPSLFVYKRGDHKFDMIDGQQRTRSIVKFLDGQFAEGSGNYYSERDFPEFLNYVLTVTIITVLEEKDSLESFYTRVNKLGKRLNRPELNKAEFIHTNFLKLVEELSQLEDFKKLDLFRALTIIRMNDRDFVEEIISFIKLGFTDKKLAVDKLFKTDLTDEETESLKSKFIMILSKIVALNEIYPINKTRFRQKNDFYTLFSLIYLNNEIDQEIINTFYRILVSLGPDISPSNGESEYLKEYALKCVSQSNSKDAREKRYEILKKILLNDSGTPNSAQIDVQNYLRGKYSLADLDYIQLDRFYTFNWIKLNSVHNLIRTHVD